MRYITQPQYGVETNFKDKTDNHCTRIFGSAVLMPLVIGGVSCAPDQVSDNDRDSDATSTRDGMISAIAAKLGQTALQLPRKNMNMKLTLEIRPEYQLSVIVTKDGVY